MILSPRVAIERGWIRNVIDKCIQPSSIDVRLNKLFRIEDGLVVGVKSKILPNWIEEFPDENGFFHLKKFTAYQFLALEFVKLPSDVAMRVYFRSTLNRGGVFVGAGWWDPGFENYVGASFYPFCDTQIEKGARVAQVVFIKAESVSSYNGSYNISTFNP